MKKIIFILLSTIIFSGSNKLGETKRIEPDFKSYEKISGSYYKDSNYIYYNGDRQYLIDLNSFELLNGSYSKDKNGIYIPQRQIKVDLCQYFGQKFRFFCESPPPLTIRTEMLAGYHPKAKNSKQAIHIAFVRLNCSISLSNNQGQAPLGRLASP